ncbi:MAG: R2-like ligand-binding oxidase [Anaerolineae bacterium]|nr:R2-like ligand-binding oxidase [Promineifilum sp.]MCW5847043.1 R2-like ligand-binding oxidase [Anaerolineae bacterium]
MPHTQFTTTTHGLRRDLPAMRLFEKAKRLGIWNPSDIDLRADREHWLSLAAEEQDILLRLTAMFQAGEEAVTLDLLPLIMTIAAEGRVEEELFLTTFLFEEAKHTDFFNRFLTAVAGVDGDLSHYHTPSYRQLFYRQLPEALGALRDDPSAAAQVRASVTYNMIVEGMLAETGYHAYFTVLERSELMPGTRRGIALLKQDESRHIAYGIYLLSRLVAEEGALWDVLEDRMNELLPAALGVIGDVFAAYDPVPFDLVEEDFTDYALAQFQKRVARLERARAMSLEEIASMTNVIIERDDG